MSVEDRFIMSPITYISLLAVHQTTTDVDGQIEFCKNSGLVVERGYEPLQDVPEDYYSSRGISRSDLVKKISLRVPTDPFMHLTLCQWMNITRAPVWAAPFNQVGSCGFSILVDDIEGKVKQMKKDFPDIDFLCEPYTMQCKWGKTTTALFNNIEDIQVQLIALEQGSVYDLKKITVPAFNDMQWLQFMLNCANYDKSIDFYKSFNIAHDLSVDFRPGVGFHPFGKEYYAKQWMDAFNFKQDDLTGVGLLRSDRDHSGMHLELMKHSSDAMTDPDDKSTWQQKGICRYCFRVENYAAGLVRQKSFETRTYVADQRGCLGWGDTQWFFCGDVDGNMLTQE